MSIFVSAPEHLLRCRCTSRHIVISFLLESGHPARRSARKSGVRRLRPLRTGHLTARVAHSGGLCMDRSTFLVRAQRLGGLVRCLVMDLREFIGCRGCSERRYLCLHCTRYALPLSIAFSMLISVRCTSVTISTFQLPFQTPDTPTTSKWIPDLFIIVALLPVGVHPRVRHHPQFPFRASRREKGIILVCPICLPCMPEPAHLLGIHLAPMVTQR